jgi:hypothetical protein
LKFVMRSCLFAPHNMCSSTWCRQGVDWIQIFVRVFLRHACIVNHFPISIATVNGRSVPQPQAPRAPAPSAAQLPLLSRRDRPNLSHLPCVDSQGPTRSRSHALNQLRSAEKARGSGVRDLASAKIRSESCGIAALPPFSAQRYAILGANFFYDAQYVAILVILDRLVVAAQIAGKRWRGGRVCQG